NLVVNALSASVSFDGGPGTDTLTVNGTAGPDVFTITASTVTRTGWGTISYNTGVEQLVVNGLAGDDSFAVNGTSLPTILSVGEGNDGFTVNANSASAGRIPVDGGPGSDMLPFN